MSLRGDEASEFDNDRGSVDLENLARRRQRVVVAVVVCGIVLTLSAFIMAMWNRSLQRAGALDQSTVDVGSVLQTALDIHLEGTELIAALFRASEFVTRDEFSDFVSPFLQRHSGVQAFEWAPRVSSSGRVACEAAVRDEGFPDFRFTERNSSGVLVTAGQRGEYFPVIYLEPMAGNEAAFGYADMGVTRAAGIGTARDSGRPTATSRLKLIQGGDEQFGMLVFVPLYEGRHTPPSVAERRHALTGFIEGVFRMDDLVDATLQNFHLSGVCFALFDVDDREDSRPLVLWQSGVGTIPVFRLDQDAGRALRADIVAGQHRVRELALADRRFELLVYPGRDFEEAYAPWSPYVVLTGGLFLNALLLVYFLLYQTRASRVERLVHRQTLALYESQARLVHSQKMESVGRLAGGIAHDFNNLLSAILGNAQLAIMNLKDQRDDAAENMDQVCQAAEKAAVLTRQLLTFSRRDLISPHVVDLNSVVASSKSMLQRILGERVNMNVEFARQEAWVLADPNQIEQIIVNLAVNASDAMESGGFLTLAVAVVPPLADDENPRVRLSVTDDGCGMSSETISRMFEPFFTTKDRDRGTGLGLSTVYGIVTQSNGTIEVDSEQGRGSRFDIYLPLVAKPAAVVSEKMKTDFADHLRQGRILVVEDDASVREAVSSFLRKVGFEVWSAGCGEEALKLVSGCGAHERIQVVLSDLVMPGMDGLELNRQLRRLPSPPEFLFMTGYAAEKMVEELAAFGDVHLLHKPFTNQKLLAEIDALMPSV